MDGPAPLIVADGAELVVLDVVVLFVVLVEPEEVVGCEDVLVLLVLVDVDELVLGTH